MAPLNFYRPKYSLRILLGFCLAVCALLAIWQLPFTITTPLGNGNYRKTVVRRGWDGNLYHHGALTDYHANGTKRREFTRYGGHAKWWCVNTPPDARYWDKDGREISATIQQRKS